MNREGSFYSIFSVIDYMKIRCFRWSLLVFVHFQSGRFGYLLQRPNCRNPLFERRKQKVPLRLASNASTSNVSLGSYRSTETF